MVSAVAQIIIRTHQVLQTVEQVVDVDRRFQPVAQALFSLVSVLEAQQPALDRMEDDVAGWSSIGQRVIDGMEVLLRNCQKAAERHLARRSVLRIFVANETTDLCLQLVEETMYQIQILNLTVALETYMEQQREARLQELHRALENQQMVSQKIISTLATALTTTRRHPDTGARYCLAISSVAISGAHWPVAPLRVDRGLGKSSIVSTLRHSSMQETHSYTGIWDPPSPEAFDQRAAS